MTTLKRHLAYAAALLLLAAAAARAAGHKDPVAHLPFDGDGGAARLTVTDRISVPPGRVGRALSLDNVREKLAPADHPNGAYIPNWAL